MAHAAAAAADAGKKKMAPSIARVPGSAFSEMALILGRVDDHLNGTGFEITGWEMIRLLIFLLAAGFGDTCNPSNASLPIWLMLQYWSEISVKGCIRNVPYVDHTEHCCDNLFPKLPLKT